MEPGSEMIKILDGLFTNSSNYAKQAIVRDLMNTHMTGKNVQEYCHKMMLHISCAEVIWVKMEQEMHIGMILEFLLDNFN